MSTIVVFYRERKKSSSANLWRFKEKRSVQPSWLHWIAIALHLLCQSTPSHFPDSISEYQNCSHCCLNHKNICTHFLLLLLLFSFCLFFRCRSQHNHVHKAYGRTKLLPVNAKNMRWRVCACVRFYVVVFELINSIIGDWFPCGISISTWISWLQIWWIQNDGDGSGDDDGDNDGDNGNDSDEMNIKPIELHQAYTRTRTLSLSPWNCSS